MIKLQVPNDPRLLQLAGEFLIAAASVGAYSNAVPLSGNQTRITYETDADEEQTADHTPLAASNPPPPPAATAAGELDLEGFPWDSRIHTKAKSKLAGGAWKLTPGVDKALVAQVRAEYLANSQATAGANPPPPEATFNGAMAALAGQTPPPPAETVAAAVTTPAATTNPVALFQDTMKLYAAATTSKLITADWAAEWCKQAGLTGLPGLMANPSICGQFADLLRSMGAQ